ncbi:MAG: hypothetical protein U0U67_15870 [Chitinophagales bacterium]
MYNHIKIVAGIVLGIVFTACESNEGKFYGKVVDQNGKSLNNVSVEVIIPDEKDLKITTNRKGRFEFQLSVGASPT